ncbi:MAG: hypothetical protein U9Q90_01375 [Campylobacterota bacterium]|nr:hypothetical protein [Campylobacterota bacterium]
MEKSNDRAEELQTEEHVDDIDVQNEVAEMDSEEKESVELSSESSETLPKSTEELIEEARAIVNQSDSEVKDCMQILDEDISKYEQTKTALFESSVNETEKLLEEVGFEPEKIDAIGEGGLKFSSSDPVEPMQVKDLSSGKFSAFLLALVAGFAVVAGWSYAASKKMGMTLDVSKVPSEETRNTLFSTIGGWIDLGENPMIGMGIVAVSALLVMWAVYSLRVFLRKNKNLKIAEEVNEEAKFYCTKKEECKKEMDKVSAHIHEVIEALGTFKVFFDEENAKMKRILYLEGTLPFNEYHQKSKEEMENTNLLVNSLNALVTTPMAGASGSLSQEGIHILEKAKGALQRFREKLYA